MIDTDIRNIILIMVLTFSMPAITWYLIKRVTSVLTNSIDELKQKLDKYIEVLLVEYVRKADYMEDQKAIKKTIERIFDKIDRCN